MKILEKSVVAIVALVAFSGCGSSKKELLKMDESQVGLRSIQSRAFDTVDKDRMLGTVISALQDLGYIVGEVNEVIGTVSAKTTHTESSWYKKEEKLPVYVTVSVRPRGETQLLVRANAEYDDEAVEDPSVYQDFFAVLEKSVFLAALGVD